MTAFLVIAQFVAIWFKLAGFHDLSWWAVLLPLWFGIALAIVHTILFFIALRYLERL